MLDKKCLIFGGAFFMGRYPDEVELAVIKYCVDESHSKSMKQWKNLIFLRLIRRPKNFSSKVSHSSWRI